MNNNEKKARQLGEPLGTASARLRKQVLFRLLVEFERNTCHRCNAKIEAVAELSLEHKIPWLDSTDPIRLFFDPSNIAFSHLRCNAGDARRPNKRYASHEEMLIAWRPRRREYEQNKYTPERRREKYVTKGY